MSDIELISFILKGFAAFGLSMMLFALLPKTRARRFLAFLISSFIAFTFAKTPQQQNLGNLQSAANFAGREQLSALMSEEEESDDSEEAEESCGLEEVATPNFYLEAPNVSTCTNAVGITMNWDSSIIIGDYMAYITGFANLGEDYSFERRVYPSNGATNHTEYISYSSFPTNTVPSQYFFAGRLEEDFDHDQIPDDWERQNGFDPTVDDAAVDSDNDGLSNLQEYLLGTNPRNQDSDGDRINDGYEVDNGYAPMIKDADRDSDNDGIPDYLATEIEGIGENGCNTNGVPNILVWALGIETLAELDDIPLGKTPATPNPILRGEDCWPTSRSREYYLEGLFEATVEFGENTESSATSVYGISWPGGTTSITSIEDLEFDSIDCDTDSVFDVTITGAVFRVARTGWYSFKIQADDYAEMLLGTNVVATSAWNDATQSIDSEEGRILLIAGDSPVVTINIHNNGGPGSFHIDKFGDFTEAVRPTLCVNFEASEIVCRESRGTVPRKPKEDQFTWFYIDAIGGDLGCEINFSITNQISIAHVVKDVIPTGKVTLAQGEEFHLKGIYGSVSTTPIDNPVVLGAELEENITKNTLSQTATLAVVSPEIQDFTTTHVWFNHDYNSSEEDGVNIRKNATLPAIMPTDEWTNDGVSNFSICYVANKTITIKAKFDLHDSINGNFTIDADVTGANFTKLSEETVTFVNGYSTDYVTFTANATVGNAITKAPMAIKWNLKGTQYSSLTGAHIYYIILDKPQLPWKDVYGDVSSLWTDALDIACVAAEGESTKSAALAKVTQALFDRGYKYNTASDVVVNFSATGKFRLSSYLNNVANIVDCTTQAYGLSALAAGLGIDTTIVFRQPFGYIRKTWLVGVSEECNNPAFESEDWYCKNADCKGNDHEGKPLGRAVFANHKYVIYNDNVYDACIGPYLGTLGEDDYLRAAIEIAITISEEYISIERKDGSYEIE